MPPVAPRLSPIQVSHRAAFLAKIASGEFAFEEVPTCLCGATESVQIATHDRFGIPVGVVGCPACGLLRTSPRLAAANLPAFYEADYHGLHFGIEQPTGATTLVRIGQGAAIWAFSRAYLGSTPSRHRLQVVDIGAGTGVVLRELEAAAKADGVDVESVGCEYSSAFATMARERGTEVRTGGLETLIGTGLQPDLVVMSHVLEHFPDPAADLARVKGLVQPTTLVYVEVPGVLTIDTKPQYDYELVKYLTLAHTYHFTLGTLVEAMERAGFAFVRGDEEVRALFRLADARAAESAISRPVDDPATRFARVLAYLSWLDRSARMRLRRFRLHARRGTRAAVRQLARRTIGKGGIRAIKRLLRR